MASMQSWQEEHEHIRNALTALGGAPNAWRRGKDFEKILNYWFLVDGILVRGPFIIRCREGGGAVEQVDSAIELQRQFYVVEAKWLSRRIGPREISTLLARLIRRRDARGIFIASPGYTNAAIEWCRESLGQATIVLCDLEELRCLLEYGYDLKRFLWRKIEHAVIDCNPYHRILCTPTAGP